uniref:Phycoerythrin alpha chain domain-containing protein n=1 Tax=Hanusia phi TaxID=3032 RepID=A0A7S0F3K2_9CRYP
MAHSPAMLTRAAAVAAVLGSAAAFAPAPVAPRSATGLRMAAGYSTASPYSSKNSNMGPAFAPVITIFDNRGCKEHKNKEYNGPKAGDENDEMLVKVANQKIPFPTDDVVNEFRRENLAIQSNLDLRAPQITIFDHRGCSRPPKEYTGKRAGTYDDEMLVKIDFKAAQVNSKLAQQVLEQTIGVLKAK